MIEHLFLYSKKMYMNVFCLPIFFYADLRCCLNMISWIRWFQIELAQDMGYACARFGHVMFPENVYEPVLRCSELLLEGVGRGSEISIFVISFFCCSISICLWPEQRLVMLIVFQ